MEKEMRQKTFGLSFAGGGVHGWAELAVYEEVEKQDIRIDAVTGTSMGSFLAAAVASGLTSKQIKNIIEETDQVIEESKLFNRRALLNLFSFRQPMGLVLMDKIMKVIKPMNDLYGEFIKGVSEKTHGFNHGMNRVLDAHYCTPLTVLVHNLIQFLWTHCRRYSQNNFQTKANRPITCLLFLDET